MSCNSVQNVGHRLSSSNRLLPYQLLHYDVNSTAVAKDVKTQAVKRSRLYPERRFTLNVFLNYSTLIPHLEVMKAVLKSWSSGTCAPHFSEQEFRSCLMIDDVELLQTPMYC